MTAAAALSRVERAKANVRETAARLAAEEARPRKNRANLAIVDPPYGIKINMNQGRRKGDTIKHARKNWDAAPPPDGYWDELKRVSRNQIVWGANNFAWLPPHNGWIVWDKDITGDVDFSKAELAYNSTKSTVDLVRIRAQSGAETYTNKIHPTQKPVALYAWTLRKFAKPGDRILDTHLGSGSIAIACHYAGHPLTACEIDKDYYEAALKRIKRETAQMTLIDTPNPGVLRTRHLVTGTQEPFVGREIE